MTVRMMKNEVDVRGGDAEDDYIYDGDDNVFGGEDADGNLSTRYWSLSSLLSSSSLWCFQIVIWDGIWLYSVFLEEDCQDRVLDSEDS